MERCYNCGLPGHLTQNCPSYGPRFPAPGKTGQDYSTESQRIADLIALDIVNQHRERHDDEPLSPSSGNHRISEEEFQRRSYLCATCGAKEGNPCTNKDGKRIGKVHVSRIRQMLRDREQLQRL